MIRIVNIFIVGLLLCSLMIDSLIADKIGKTLVYRITSNKKFNVEPNSSTTYLKVNTDVYMRQEGSLENVLAISLRNASIFLQNEDSETINLTNCLTKETLSALQATFLAVFNINGALDHILVNKNEPEISKNIKLLGTSLLQIDQAQVQGYAPPVTRRFEPFYTGVCPVTSVISRSNGQILIKKISDLDKCSEVYKDYRSNTVTTLKNTCRPAHLKNVQWQRTSDIQVADVNGQNVIKNLVFKEQLKYHPFKQSNLQSKFDASIEANLIDVGSEIEIRPFARESSTIVYLPQYKKINAYISQINDEEGSELKVLYNALTCQQSYSFLYEDIIERAINCKSAY